MENNYDIAQTSKGILTINLYVNTDRAIFIIKLTIDTSLSSDMSIFEL